jgi:FixJ family two-component response regulator
VEGAIISVVDDDTSLRTATVRLLRSTGIAVRSFASAQEYLLSPRLYDTCCLVAVVQMPGMSGVKLQKYLMNAGPIGSLTKPFDEPRSFECVEQALMKGRATPDKI